MNEWEEERLADFLYQPVRRGVVTLGFLKTEDEPFHVPSRWPVRELEAIRLLESSMVRIHYSRYCAVFSASN